jgi:hypothetical protein
MSPVETKTSLNLMLATSCLSLFIIELLVTSDPDLGKVFIKVQFALLAIVQNDEVAKKHRQSRKDFAPIVDLLQEEHITSRCVGQQCRVNLVSSACLLERGQMTKQLCVGDVGQRWDDPLISARLREQGVGPTRAGSSASAQLAQSYTATLKADSANTTNDYGYLPHATFSWTYTDNLGKPQRVHLKAYVACDHENGPKRVYIRRNTLGEVTLALCDRDATHQHHPYRW